MAADACAPALKNQAGSLGSSVWAYGGGVYNNAFSTMTLSNCTVTGNSLSTQGYSYGGGVYNNGTMTLSGCTVTGNSAGPAGTSFFEGGGIGNDNQGQLTILSSVVTGNTASTGYNIANVGWISISPDSTVGQDPTGTGGKKNKK